MSVFIKNNFTLVVLTSCFLGFVTISGYLFTGIEEFLVIGLLIAMGGATTAILALARTAD